MDKRNSKEAINKRRTPGIRHGRHCVFNLHVHLVFVPKYRKNLFSKEALETAQNAFAKVCADFEGELVEFNGEPDHVHLLINYPPKISVSRLVNSLKGVSSRHLSHRHNEIKRFIWSGSLWSRSYFAASCGGASLEVVKQYIQDQTNPV